MTIRSHHHLIATVAFSTVLLGLIAWALGATNPAIAGWTLLSVAFLAFVFHRWLHSGGFFAAVFANAIGIYACVYVFFLSENFSGATPLVQQIGFVVPLAGFLSGMARNRRAISAAAHRVSDPTTKSLLNSMAWLLPLGLIGAVSFLVPRYPYMDGMSNTLLLAAMTMIAILAAISARGIAVFLIDTGLLFEEFLQSVSELVKPAVALMTCYSLLGIIFGCLYTILDRYALEPAFQIGLAVRHITFAEALYFSIATISTVGYGDVSAVSPLARILVSIEIFCGLLLILFGVEAILSARRSPPNAPPPKA